MKPIIEVKNLTKKFGSYTAVDNISFSVQEGEIVGLLGPNGAGKTTTTLMLLGVIEPTAGSIEIFGQKMPKERSKILKRTNFSASYTKLPWHLAIAESLYVFALLYEIDNPGQRIDKLLKLFDVYDLKRKTGGYLSSGQTTRVQLCKALLNNPKLLFLDEPTASLDPEIAVETRNYLKKIQHEEKVTIFLTSHNMAEVEELCDRVIFLSSGKIVVEDTPESLARKIKRCKVSFMIVDGQKRTVSLANKQGWQANWEGRYVTVTLKEDEIILLLKNLTKMGIEYREISIEKPTLEDYFLEVVRKT